MPVECTIRDRVLALSVSGVVSNHEIETAVAAALAGVQPRTRVRLLWDARKTETPLTADDMAWRFALVSSLAKREVISRGALLVRDAPSSLLEVSRTELRKALRDFQCDVFTDESEARTWLNA
jgi:hypothetical protein